MPGPTEHFIVQEELARARAPEMVGRIGLNLAAPDPVGPRHRRAEGPLAVAASGRPRTCGASCSASPGRAATWPESRRGPRRSTGGWLVNGQKVWTSYAQFADWGVCLARTDPDAPKHKGISYLVVDMHDPGRRGAAAWSS